MNTKETTVYFAASITVEGRSEWENIERIQNLLTKWEKELSKGTVDLNLAGVPAVAANFDTVTYDLTLPYDQRDKATRSVCWIRYPANVTLPYDSPYAYLDAVTYDLRDEDIADEVDDGR